MKLPWRRARGSPNSIVGEPAPEPGPVAAQACPSLGRVLSKVLREERPAILDVGPFCGATAIFLADRGARVSVGEIEPPAPVPPRRPKFEPPAEPPPPFRIEQPSAAFHLVLAWEFVDFVPPSRLSDFAAELDRVLRGGGWVLMLALADGSRKAQAPRRPPRYRVLAEDRVACEPAPGPPLERHVHPAREIERGLAPLVVQGIHLQRSQMREVLLYKPMR